MCLLVLGVAVVKGNLKAFPVQKCGISTTYPATSLLLLVGLRLDWAETVVSRYDFRPLLDSGAPGLWGLAPATFMSSGCGLLGTPQLWQLTLAFAFSPSPSCVLSGGLDRYLSSVGAHSATADVVASTTMEKFRALLFVVYSPIFYCLFMASVVAPTSPSDVCLFLAASFDGSWKCS